MLNKVILLGRLTADVEVSQTQSGLNIQKFSLAVNTGKDKDGNEDTSFFNCVAFDNHAVDFLHKGDRTIISGRLNQRKYENKEHKTVSVVEILVDSVELIEPKKEDPQEAPVESKPAPKAKQYYRK